MADEQDEIFEKSQRFKDLGLRGSVVKGTEQAGYEHPTDIQAKLIPRMLTGKDILGQAKTGTGKTAAFGLPLLHMAEKDQPLQALILTPTRELAAQVASEIDEVGAATPIRTVNIIGGESMRQQSNAIKKGAHLIVGTPGRIMDLYGRGQLPFDHIRYVVLDEVDRMLDIGFREDIRKILKAVGKDRQTVFVSATINEDIEKLARRFMREDGEKIESESGALTVSQVEQHYIPVPNWAKRRLLEHLLDREKPESTLVFCRTKATVHRLAEHLRKKGHACREIHGDMRQEKRKQVMSSMRGGEVDLLIASDLAARGLDIAHITDVINYDLPDDPEVYVHRIGRTARAGRHGRAWSFVTPDQGQLLTEIEKLTGVLIERRSFDDFDLGEAPPGEEPASAEPRKEPDPQKALAERAAPAVDPESVDEEKRREMFPNGVVPKSAPRRTLGSKFKRRGR